MRRRRRLLWWAAGAWALLAPLAVAAAWLLWPQAEHPQVWRQLAAWQGFALAGTCWAWCVVSYAHLRRGDPSEVLCMAGLALLGLSFLASPLVVWLAWLEGPRAQYVAWAVRLAGVALLGPYTAIYLLRRRPAAGEQPVDIQ